MRFTPEPGSAAEASVPVPEWQRQGLWVSYFRWRWCQPQMTPCQRRCGASARGADHEALAHQERFRDRLDRLWLLAHRHGEGAQTDGTTAEPATQATIGFLATSQTGNYPVIATVAGRGGQSRFAIWARIFFNACS